MTRWALGVDLGGTNLRVAAVTGAGAVLARASAALDRAAPGSGTLATRPFAQLNQLVDGVVAQVRAGHPSAGAAVGVGLGATGPVDIVTRIIDNPFTLPAGFQGDVGSVLDRYGSVVVENDADVAAVAEHRFGAGRGGRRTACLTVGTGIGVGVVSDSGVHRGPGGFHPEAGHHVVDPSGPKCYCGARGCVESLASARAVAAAAARAGFAAADATAAGVHRRAAAGDAAAIEITRRARAALCLAARNLVALHAPDTIVFAGQAIGDAGRLVAETQADLAAFPFRAEDVRVAVSQLDDLAGCLGAASLVLAPWGVEAV